MDAAQEKFIKMTTQPVERLVTRLALPSIAIMMISSLYNMADTFFVGSLGTEAVAAVGVVFPVMTVIQAFGFFFGQGAGNYLARALGAQDREGAGRMAATGVASSFAVGLLLLAAGLLAPQPIARAIGAIDSIRPQTVAYLRLIALGAPFMTTSLTLNNLLRFQGSAFYGMIGMVSGAVLNCALDPLLIFGFHMGVRGAAAATALSQAVSCALLLLGCRRGGNIALHLRNIRPNWSVYKEMFRGGMPSLLRQALQGVGAVAINHAAGSFGGAVIAAYSIVNRVTMMASSMLIGFGQGFQPVCGFNYGAKRYDRVRRAFFFCFWLGSAVLCTAAILGAVFAPRVIGLFRRGDAEVIAAGSAFLRLNCLSYPLAAWIVMVMMMLQTSGKALQASALSAARQGLTLLPLVLILTPLLGLRGLQMSVPLADLATFLVSLPLGLRMLGQLKRGAGGGAAKS
ncbi:MAG: MATE family efflux transporter [Oscillospiraceae bacterium]|jgi:putative MATE family efflux protein|nr:MATE family efflux transporter [Oscillospiraceae bacterium]